MATKKLKGLGRGLEALLGGDGDITTPDANTPSELPVTQMQAGKYQPRTRMDEGGLQELAASIKTQGIMQPILVRPVGTDKLTGEIKYEIIAGERRFRAAQIAGLEVLPVLVRDVDDQAAAAMALIENMQREDLNPLEEAQGIHRLITDFSFTREVQQVMADSEGLYTGHPDVKYPADKPKLTDLKLLTAEPEELEKRNEEIKKRFVEFFGA